MGCASSNAATHKQPLHDADGYDSEGAITPEQLAVIDALWEEIEHALPKDKSNSDNGLKIVRFIFCSKFDNFRTENWVLEKEIVENLKTWCFQRRIIFMYDNLSLPPVLQNGKTAQLCLRVIRKYVNDNMMPLFCGLYDDNIGSPIKLEERVMLRHAVPNNLTLTELVTANAVYRCNNPNALCLFRDETFYSAAPNQATIRSHPIETIRAKFLRQKLQEKIPQQCMDYKFSSATYDEASNMPKCFPEAMLTDIMQFYIQRLEKEFPHHVDLTRLHKLQYGGQQKTKIDHEKEDQAAFVQERIRSVVPNLEFFKELLDPEKMRLKGITLITGGPGKGKTAAALALHDRLNIMVREGKLKCKEAEDRSFKVMSHFIGATRHSRSINLYLRRVLVELFNFREPNLPESPEVCAQLVHDLLSNDKQHPSMLIIDGFGRFNPVTENVLLNWIPYPVSTVVKIFLFMDVASPYLEATRLKKLPREVDVPQLTTATKKKLILRYRQEISKTGKDVSDDVLHALQTDESLIVAIQNPVKLKAMMYLAATEKLSTLHQLARMKMERVLHEQLLKFEQNSWFGRYLVASLCLFCSARRGLTEPELTVLISVDPEKLVPEALQAKYEFKAAAGRLHAFPSLLLEGILKEIHPYITKRENRLRLDDTQLVQFIRSKYLTHEADQHFWHARLAEIFESPFMCFIEGRKANELPYHCFHLKDMERLKRALCDFDVIEGLYNRQFSWELLKYWKDDLGGVEALEQSYAQVAVNEFKAALGENPKPADEVEKKCLMIAYILKQAKLYWTAAKVIHQLIEIETKLGSRAEIMSRLYQLQAEILEKQTLKGHFPTKVVESGDTKNIPAIMHSYQKALDYWSKAAVVDDINRKVNMVKCQLAMASMQGWHYKLSGGKGRRQVLQEMAISTIQTAEAIMRSSGSIASPLLELQALLAWANCYDEDTLHNLEWKAKALAFATEVFGPSSYTVDQLQRSFGDGLRRLADHREEMIADEARRLAMGDRADGEDEEKKSGSDEFGDDGEEADKDGKGSGKNKRHSDKDRHRKDGHSKHRHHRDGSRERSGSQHRRHHHDHHKHHEKQGRNDSEKGKHRSKRHESRRNKKEKREKGNERRRSQSQTVKSTSQRNGNHESKPRRRQRPESR